MTQIENFANVGISLSFGESKGQPTAIATVKSKSRIGFKYLFNYRFKSEERREQYLTDYIEQYKKATETKAAKLKEKKEKQAELVASDHFKEGDIVVNTWGCEQTNVEFYKVIEVLPKSLKVARIGAKMVENSMMSHGMSCDVMPNIDGEQGEQRILRLKIRSDLAVSICNPENYYYFHKWDGRPQYKSWYA